MPDTDYDTDYEGLDAQLAALIGDEPDALASTANFVALLYNGINDVNWLGVYVLRGEELVLGPFQGNTACVRIRLGDGVCGTAAASGETQLVEDVHAFPGHIVCDVASRSELVVPLEIDGKLAGVLDIDSPTLARFGEDDRVGVERLCRTFCESRSGKPTFI